MWAAHYREVSEFVNSPALQSFLRFSSFPMPSLGPHIVGKYRNSSTPLNRVSPLFQFVSDTVSRAAHCREVSKFVNPSTAFSPLFQLVSEASLGPRIVGEYLNPSTPRRAFLYLRSGSFPIPSVGPRIVGKYRNPSTPLCAFCRFPLRFLFGHRCKGAHCAWQQTFWEEVSSS